MRWPTVVALEFRLALGDNGNSGATDGLPAAFRATLRGDQVVKESKFFRKQAEKAERIARTVADPEVSENLANLAGAYRRQADLLKAARKKRGKKH